MRFSKGTVLAGAVILSSGIAAAVIAAQNPQWKGKIETVDGVKTVRNPNGPLYGEIKLDLEEDLKIGRPDDDKYLFYRVRGIEVDKGGSIYIADLSNYRIQKFDRNGAYLMTFGRKGQGPGEFDLPISVHVEEKTGNVLVQDQAFTIEFFLPDGKPLRSIRLESAYRDFRVAPDGTILAVMQTYSEKTATHKLCQINGEGKSVKTYAEGLFNMYLAKQGEVTVAATSGHELDIKFELLDDLTFVQGYSKEYELAVMDFAGKILYRIKKEESYPTFTDREKKSFKKISLPEFKPYFYAIFVDDLGRIWVQRNKTDWRTEEDIQKDIDVFSKEGYFLFRTKLPKIAYVVRKGFVYAHEIKEDHEILKRYKIKNWDALKTEW